MKNQFDIDHVTTASEDSVYDNNSKAGKVEISDAWKARLIQLFVLVLFIVTAYRETLASMVETWWRSETFAHGFLILPISLYLIWKRKDSVKRVPLRYERSSIFAFLALSTIWLLANIANIVVVQQISVVTMLIMTVIFLFGRHVAKALIFPLLYLYFMVPMGEFLIPPLQYVTAYIAVRALQFTGIPVFWEGLLFSIPSGSFEVAEACSGLRYLIASIALGTLYAYLMYSSFLKRILFIIASILVPIIANGLRAYGIVMIADLSDYQLAVGIDHLIYGWLFFGIVISILFWLGSKFRDKEDRLHRYKDVIHKTHEPEKSETKAGILFFLACGILLIVLPSLVAAGIGKGANIRVVINLPNSLSQLPEREKLDNISWEPLIEGEPVKLKTRYRGDGKALELLVAIYTDQSQGNELIKINNRFVPKGWVLTSEENLKIMDQYKMRVITANKEEKRIVLLMTYRINDDYTVSPAEAKIKEIYSILKGDYHFSALIMFKVDKDDLDMFGNEWFIRSISEILDSIRFEHIET